MNLPDRRHREVLRSMKKWSLQREGPLITGNNAVVQPLQRLTGRPVDREFGLASLIWGRLEESETKSLFDPLVEIGDLERDLAMVWTIVEATVNMTRASGTVARNSETVARTLARNRQ